jgi:hypothetical protein
VPGGTLAEEEAEGGRTADVTVLEHRSTVTVIVTVVVSERHQSQST